VKTYVTDNLPVVLQNFIADYSKIYRSALVFAVNHRLAFDTSKSELNTIIQQEFKLNKRHVNSVITDADGMIGSAKLCRANHVKQLEGKLKSATDWLKKSEKKLKDSRKFYSAARWQSKTRLASLEALLLPGFSSE